MHIFPVNFYAVLHMLGWDVKMPSSTITVRFEDELYNKIKNHEICTSDLIRDGVRIYLEMLEEEKKMNEPVISSPEPVRSYERQDVIQDKYVESYQEEPMQKRCYGQTYDKYNKTTYAMDKLKEEISSLNDEVGSLLEKYKKIDK